MSDSPSAVIRVLLADDHDMVRSGLRSWLQAEPDIVIVAEARDGAEAVQLAGETDVDVLLIDMHMPVKNGLEVIRELRRKNTRLRILVMTGYDQSLVKAALDAGANGYLTKEEKREVVVQAVRWAAGNASGVWVSPSVTQILYQTQNALQQADLTKAELKVLSHINLPNNQLAVLLQITEATLKNHLSNIYFKIAVSNRSQAAQWARRFGLTGAEDTDVDR